MVICRQFFSHLRFPRALPGRMKIVTNENYSYRPSLCRTLGLTYRVYAGFARPSQKGCVVQCVSVFVGLCAAITISSGEGGGGGRRLGCKVSTHQKPCLVY
jgi:hypothetical protein